MKTKLALLLVFAALTVSAQTNSIHTWTLKTGAAFSGDYISSGTQMVVIKDSGTNCLLKISDLSTNDWLYFYQCKTNQRQMHLDAEAAQMRAAGWLEFTSDLIMNFPEKVRDQIPGDGTIIHKYGWMDATFEGFSNDSVDNALHFSVRDSTEQYFHYCTVIKWLKNSVADVGTPNPFADSVSKLKDGDKVRFFGNCDDSAGFSWQTLDNERLSHCWFFIDRIEMIESAVDAAAVKKVKEDMETSR
jgi:hypothetical protein